MPSGGLAYQVNPTGEGDPIARLKYLELAIPNQDHKFTKIRNKIILRARFSARPARRLPNIRQRGTKTGEFSCRDGRNMST